MDSEKIRLGNLIRESRVRKGLTMAQLAKKLDLTTSAVQKYEQGGGFSRNTASKLSSILGIRIESLYGIDNHSTTIVAHERSPTPTNIDEISETFARVHRSIKQKYGEDPLVLEYTTLSKMLLEKILEMDQLYKRRLLEGL